MSEPKNPARILVVDDEERNRRLLVAMLEADGYTALEAADGPRALELARQDPPDVVLLDIMMPGMDGYEVACALKADAATKAIPIVMVTALDDRDARLRGLEAGAEEFVTKPVDRNELRIRVRNLLRLKQFSDLLADHNRLLDAQVKERTHQLLSAQAQKEAAEARAALADQLERANRELKETQVQLVQAAKMSSLGQLVAGIAHEINNPLAFVLSHHRTVGGLLDKLAPEIGPGLSEPARGQWSKAARRLQEMRQGLERIEDLVLKLRTFSRLDEGEIKHVKIEESIESVLTLLQHRMKGRIAVKRNYGEVKVLSCYPGPLNQVLMNLVSNAIDAIDGQGEIAITTGRRDSMFFVSVADTGKGIPAAQLERIFEPFYTTKPVGEGTGLGLSISYGIVRRHGGAIEVRSEEGRGTEMIVKIPLADAQEEKHGR